MRLLLFSQSLNTMKSRKRWSKCKRKSFASKSENALERDEDIISPSVEVRTIND